MPDFHQGPFNNVFILSPSKIEFSYKEWNGKYVVLEYDFSGENVAQVLSGINGSKKTVSLELIKLFCDVFSMPSKETKQSFENFANSIDLHYITVKFADINEISYDSRFQGADDVGHTFLPFGRYCANMIGKYSNYCQTTEEEVEILNSKILDFFGWDEIEEGYDIEPRTRIFVTANFDNTKDKNKWEFQHGADIGIRQGFSNAGQFSIESKRKPHLSKVHENIDTQHLQGHLIYFDGFGVDWNKLTHKTGLKFVDAEELGDGTTAIEPLYHKEFKNIFIIRGSNYKKINDAYNFSSIFFEGLKTRLDDFNKLRMAFDKSNEHGFEDYNQVINQLSSENIHNERRIPEEIRVFGMDEERFDNIRNENELHSLNLVDFIINLSFHDPYAYLHLYLDDLSHILLIIISLCDDAEFLKNEGHPLTAGQRRILNLAEQYYSSSDGELILIDEPEISLHISWQRRLISAFSDLNNYLINIIDNAESNRKETISEIGKMRREHGDDSITLLGNILNANNLVRSKKFVLATHSPDIIYHHQELCLHIPPMEDELSE